MSPKFHNLKNEMIRNTILFYQRKSFQQVKYMKSKCHFDKSKNLKTYTFTPPSFLGISLISSFSIRNLEKMLYFISLK